MSQESLLRGVDFQYSGEGREMSILPMYNRAQEERVEPWTRTDCGILCYGVFSSLLLSGMGVGLGVIADSCLRETGDFSYLCGENNGIYYALGSVGCAVTSVAIAALTRYGLKR